MSATYLQVTVTIWGFLFATVVGVAIHTIRRDRRERAFTDHALTALSMVQSCWPARDIDDEAVRCGACDALWTTDRVCPK